jgi:hypothetical protein
VHNTFTIACNSHAKILRQWKKSRSLLDILEVYWSQELRDKREREQAKKEQDAAVCAKNLMSVAMMVSSLS